MGKNKGCKLKVSRRITRNAATRDIKHIHELLDKGLPLSFRTVDAHKETENALVPEMKLGRLRAVIK